MGTVIENELRKEATADYTDNADGSMHSCYLRHPRNPRFCFVPDLGKDGPSENEARTIFRKKSARWGVGFEQARGWGGRTFPGRGRGGQRGT